MNKDTEILKIAGGKYLLGLWWHPVDEGETALARAREVSLTSPDTYYDGYCSVADPYYRMVGLGTWQRGSRSLAAVFESHFKEENVLLLVDIGDRRNGWLFCKQSGFIHSGNGDEFGRFGVLAQSFESLSSGSWDVKQELTFEELEEIVKKVGSKKSFAVKRLLKKGARKKQIISAALVLLVLCLAYWIIPKPEIKISVPEPTGPVESLEARKARIQAEKFPKMWEQRAQPSVLLRLVRDRWKDQILMKKGWTVTQFFWQPGKFELTWERLLWGKFKDAPAKPHPNSRNIVIVSEEATKCAVRPKRVLVEPLDAGLPLLDLGRVVNLETNLSWAPRQQYLDSDGFLEQSIPAPYVRANFELGPLKFLYADLEEIFDGIPGLILNHVSWQRGQWTIKGELYAL